MQIDITTFQLAIAIITLANLVCVGLAEKMMLRKAKCIQATCLHGNEEVPIEEAPPQIQEMAHILLEGDSIKIKMTCTLVRMHIIGVFAVLNLICILYT